MNRGILGGSQMVQGQTALLALQEEKQKQQSMQMVYEAIKHDPALAQQLLGGSVLGSLQHAPGAPGVGPMTQQTVMPGQSPGLRRWSPGDRTSASSPRRDSRRVPLPRSGQPGSRSRRRPATRCWRWRQGTRGRR